MFGLIYLVEHLISTNTFTFKYLNIMRIGILTHPLMWNYGGILQAYALQSTLEQLGHDVVIINLQKEDPLWIKILSYTKYIALKYLFHQKHRLSHKEKIRIETKQYEHNLAFVENYIHLTNRVSSKKGLKKIVKNEKIEAIIVGSDQVWRPKYVCSIYYYYLNFLPKTCNIKRIAYGASFGVSDWEYSKIQTYKCRKLAHRFNYLSVREISGVHLCQKFLHRTATHVLDPTMLLSTSNYIPLFHHNDITKPNGIYTYFLDPSKDKDDVVKIISKQIGQSSIINEHQNLPSVTRWMHCIYNSKYVITDSFHGTVFAILFNKPFIVYSNNKRGSARFDSLLKLFQLENRLINSRDDLQYLSYSNINWEIVNNILFDKRQESISFLIHSLK